MRKLGPFLGAVAVVLLGLTSAGTQEPQKKSIDQEIKENLTQLQKLQEQVNALKAQQAPKADPPPAQGDSPRQFKTGARPTPLPKILEAIATGRAAVHRMVRAPPASVLRVPPKLSYLGNNQHGDCVTAESCFSMEAYSVGLGLPEIVITDQAAIDWARAHGVLEGADLLEVIQAMEKDGIKDANGVLRKAGTPSSVDYTNETILQSAIAQGPVSIAIASGSLPSGAGNGSGWYVFGGRKNTRTDHCISISSYADKETLFAALGVPVPANAPSGKLYMIYTWAGQGIADHQWIMNTVVEGWVRTPTVTGLTPPTPPTPPSPLTVAVADVKGEVGQPITFLPIASGGTGPYTFAYDYGDGSKDVSNTHIYKTSGSYKVTIVAADSKGATGTGTCTTTIGTGPGPGPLPGYMTITLAGSKGDDGTYYAVPQSVGNTRLIDVLTPRAPQPSLLTPEEAQLLRGILDRLSKAK